mmetsp:Transcript_374/g.549  ORF Transcript_374/g.549 Transcript_374/m.549 type:complete len:223 (-) Transcript_374:947-1615(-)|eukprot:CAMPEP_0184480098 /NCGR_PEP_ID=MMETSP0113_2-20130426/1601_1 /TAXON_ID=91329 /ORGANISM="Norrisiella sphaerica, Strain BC52" /LENGTH=222 /DNA_ID=CAMNT_0026858361 /DNA_START=90 /DNA_END=758 /DNA_ORIENTATION=-
MADENVETPAVETKEDSIDADLADFEASLKMRKKKKKKKKKPVEEGKDNARETETIVEKADYPYTELLERCFKLLMDHNPNLNVKKKHIIPPPSLHRVGTRRTCWANFPQICKLLKRNTEHMQAYVLAELGADASNDGNGRLVIKGRYVPKQIESLLKKYIFEYVTCRMCRSPETTLSRDPMTRLYFIECGVCQSKRSVAPIKSGYHATMRADRRKLKMQAK